MRESNLRVGIGGKYDFESFGESLMNRKRGGGFILAVIVASLFHVFGIHGAMAPVIQNDLILLIFDIAVFGFVFGLEHFSVTLLRFWLDDVLKKIAFKYGTKKLNLLGFLLIRLVLIGLTIFGAIEGVKWYNFNKSNNYVTSSLEYKTAKAEVDAGAKREAIFDDRMEQWRKDKLAHDADCEAQWLGDFRTKRAQCKENFRHAPSSKDIAVSHEISSIDLAKINQKYDGGAGLWSILLAVILALLLDSIAVYPMWADYFQQRQAFANNPEILTNLRNRETYRKDAETLYLKDSGLVFQEYFKQNSSNRVTFDKYASFRKLQEENRLSESYINAMTGKSANNEHYDKPIDEYNENRTGCINLIQADDLDAFVRIIFKNGEVTKGGKTLSVSNYTEIGEGSSKTDNRQRFTRTIALLVGFNIVENRGNGQGYFAKMEMNEALEVVNNGVN